MGNQKTNGSIIAIITMMFLYAMISFVTNLGAPIGVIWKNQPEIGGSNVLGIMGNFMNFFAYLFMGIPAGKMLTKVGYKKTALIGIAVGFVGVLIQYLSGFSGGIPGFCIYLFGAFISGFSVCILNTVVNPMLNLLGGGGNRGNQLNMIGGTLNSLAGTMTPMPVGALIGTVTASTQMADVNLVMYIAMTVFAAAFVALIFIPIKDPEMGKVTAETVFEHSPWSFRHCLLGVIAIFVYVGVEVGIPGGLNFYLSDTSANGAWVNPDAVVNAATIGGAVAAMYWLLMLVGRLCSSFIAAKVSSRHLMLIATFACMILILAAIFTPKSVTVSMPLISILEGTDFGSHLHPEECDRQHAVDFHSGRHHHFYDSTTDCPAARALRFVYIRHVGLYLQFGYRRTWQVHSPGIRHLYDDGGRWWRIAGSTEFLRRHLRIYAQLFRLLPGSSLYVLLCPHRLQEREQGYSR